MKAIDSNMCLWCVYVELWVYISQEKFGKRSDENTQGKRALSIRATVDSGGAIDPVPVEYRRNHRLKAELT